MDGIDLCLTAPNFLEAAHNGYRHLWITDLTDNHGHAGEQTHLLFRRYNDILLNNSCTLPLNCIRTWLFVREIDLRYTDVVNARTAFFNTHGLTSDTHYIASTGIEGRTADSSAFVSMDAIAVTGLQESQIHFLHAPHHLNRTTEYGVTFERGTAISYGDRRHIYISGTASIDHLGNVLHPGDILAQAQRAFLNIQALLKEADASLNDIKQAIVYLRDSADYTLVEQFLRIQTPLNNYLIVIAPVCRPAWLIEIECIAVTKHGNACFPNL
jgi:enamine deaminase RidA (YjgF/YER057c/UK114 family)